MYEANFGDRLKTYASQFQMPGSVQSFAKAESKRFSTPSESNTQLSVAAPARKIRKTGRNSDVIFHPKGITGNLMSFFFEILPNYGMLRDTSSQSPRGATIVRLRPRPHVYGYF